MNGQGQAWITTMDYYTSYTPKGKLGWMCRYKYDYIRLTETMSDDVAYPVCNKNLSWTVTGSAYILSSGCLSDSTPQLQKAFQSVSYHTSSDNCHGTHTTSLKHRQFSLRLISRSSMPVWIIIIILYFFGMVHFWVGSKHCKKYMPAFCFALKKDIYWKKKKWY